jgi:OOP family OmpA-OmpF porin
MRRAVVALALLAGAAWLAGCSNDLVVVLPASDGHIGGVVVKTNRGAFVLDQPYAEAKAGLTGLSPGKADAKDVDTAFSSALAARPIPPKDYNLYFLNDSDVLTPPSREAFEAIFPEIARRKAAEIVITGHTDTMGALEYNDKLSLDRANAVEKLFEKQFADHGISGDSISTAGRGKRELLKPTPDQTPEPLNRRVVITVR